VPGPSTNSGAASGTGPRRSCRHAAGAPAASCRRRLTQPFSGALARQRYRMAVAPRGRPAGSPCSAGRVAPRGRHTRNVRPCGPAIRGPGGRDRVPAGAACGSQASAAVPARPWPVRCLTLCQAVHRRPTQGRERDADRRHVGVARDPAVAETDPPGPPADSWLRERAPRNSRLLTEGRQVQRPTARDAVECRTSSAVGSTSSRAGRWPSRSIGRSEPGVGRQARGV